MRLYGKEYSLLEDEENTKFLIDGKDGTECKGKSFYKYYGLSQNSVDALTNMYVYATHPCLLNDPLDCAGGLIKYDSFKCACKLWDHLYPSVFEICHHDEVKFLAFTNLAYRTLLYTKLGVLSLSAKWDDLSMWSTYCSHKGFCAEFDIFEFPFKTRGPFHVNYQEVLTPVSINESSLQIASIVQTNVKLKCWEHEDEWRLLIDNPSGFDMEPFGEWATAIKEAMPDYHDRKFRYPLRCLKSVILGMKFFNGVHEVITDNECEVMATDILQDKVLSFLAMSRKPTYLLETNDLSVNRKRIEIYKIREKTYRIIT